jgi:hypothetical protein
VGDVAGAFLAVRARGIGTWPSPDRFAWIDRRLGFYFVLLGVANGLLSIAGQVGWDFDIYWSAGKSVAAGGSAYAATLALGADQWGVGRTYVYPPFLAHVMAPLTALPEAVGFAIFTAAGVAAVLLAFRLLDEVPTARRVPRIALGLGALWITVFVGQVNLFVLAGLVLVVGSRNDRLAGAGLALAVLLRVTPAVFVLVLLAQRRWAATAWAAVFTALGAAVGYGEWESYLAIVRTLGTLPPVQSLWQTSLAAIWLPLAVVAAAAVAVVFVAAGRRPSEAHVIRGTALGLGLLLVPGSSWFHWVAFTSAPLLVDGHRFAWSRRLLLALVVASWLIVPVGSWLTTAVAVVALTGLCRRVLAVPRATVSAPTAQPLPEQPGGESG